jgi:uncharacterized membrane protein
MSEDRIQPFRQPLVTSIGILPGFTLNVASNWVSRAFASNRFSEYVLAAGLFIHIRLYLIVLYRILNIDYPRDRYEFYYRRTLALFITGITIDFFIYCDHHNR